MGNCLLQPMKRRHDSLDSHQSRAHGPTPASNPAIRHSTSAMDIGELVDEKLKSIFTEALITAKHAVQLDENEDYEQALELYIQVVELYNRVIAFPLTTEEKWEVRNTASMYTRRCKVIQEAFADECETRVNLRNSLDEIASVTEASNSGGGGSA